MVEEQNREKTSIEQKQQKFKLIEILPKKTSLKKISDIEKHEYADKYAKKKTDKHLFSYALNAKP